jgi:hypothetical protein
MQLKPVTLAQLLLTLAMRSATSASRQMWFTPASSNEQQHAEYMSLSRLCVPNEHRKKPHSRACLHLANSQGHEATGVMNAVYFAMSFATDVFRTPLIYYSFSLAYD